MTIKLAINGYGRIGRNALRALFENNRHAEFEIVAINDLSPIETNAHLTRFDTTHGIFKQPVAIEGEYLVVDGKKIKIYQSREPENLPWKVLNVDVVLECTGAFANRTKASAHLKAGAKKVLISAPAGNDVDATIVYGVNHDVLKASDTIVSNASCTTNCLAPLVLPLHEAFGVVSGVMTTIHAVTNDQVLVDVNHSDLRRARSAMQSMIPTKTGAAAAIGAVLPALSGKLDGLAIRVPTINVSLIDLSVTVKEPVTPALVNQTLRKASQGKLKGILDYNALPLVSVDFNHHPASSIFDEAHTKVSGQLVKVFAWYDNEWGFSNRLLDTAKAMMNA